MRADMIMSLEGAIATLTPKQAEALGPWLAGYTQQEIGDACGVKKAAICRRINRALCAIREALM